MNRQLPKQSDFRLLGTQVSSLSGAELLDFISRIIQSGEKCTIVSGNIHSYNLAYEMPWMRDFLNQADIVRLDGIGVRLAAWLLGKPTTSRSTWADFGWQLAGYAQKQGYTLYLLGAHPDIVKKAAQRMSDAAPGLRVVGYHHGYFNKNAGDAETISVINEINRLRPNILIVGMGMPIQERWLAENRASIEANVVMTGGAVFDYLSGELRRAPKWMTQYGLEWLGRLLIEPKRLWRRYLVGGPTFFWRVARQRLGLLRS